MSDRFPSRQSHLSVQQPLPSPAAPPLHEASAQFMSFYSTPRAIAARLQLASVSFRRALDVGRASFDCTFAEESRRLRLLLTFRERVAQCPYIPLALLRRRDDEALGPAEQAAADDEDRRGCERGVKEAERGEIKQSRCCRHDKPCDHGPLRAAAVGIERRPDPRDEGRGELAAGEEGRSGESER